jgi:hypothetical protein
MLYCVLLRPGSTLYLWYHKMYKPVVIFLTETYTYLAKDITRMHTSLNFYRGMLTCNTIKGNTGTQSHLTENCYTSGTGLCLRACSLSNPLPPGISSRNRRSLCADRYWRGLQFSNVSRMGLYAPMWCNSYVSLCITKTFIIAALICIFTCGIPL